MVPSAYPPRRAEWPLLVLVGAVLFMALSVTVADPDLWGHLRFGQDTLAHGGPVRNDPYAYTTTPGAWVNHEWLAEASFAVAYGALGVWGLSALKTLVGFAALGTIYWRAQRHGGGLLGPVLVAALGVVTALPQLRHVRPQLYTVALMTALLLILRAYEGGRRRCLWACVPIMMAWVNLHGGVLAGAAVLLAWYGGRVLQRFIRLRGLRPWRELLAPLELGVVVAALLATLANPYGWELPGFLLRTATGPRVEIQDWQPATLNSYGGVAYVLLLLVLALVYLRGRQRPTWAQSAVLLALMVAGLSAKRHVPLLGLAVTVFAGPSLQAMLSARLDRPHSTAPAPARQRRIIAGVSLALAALALGYSLLYVMGNLYFAGADYPVRAVALLGERVERANMVTPYGWGEYVIWHLGPGVKVSMDGRRETVYDELTYQQSMAWHYGARGWEAPVDDLAAELVLTSVGRPADSLMRLKPGWVLVYGDDTASLFAREGSTLAAALQAPYAPAELPERSIFP
ncbi:MAG: hypothetical protein ACOX3S_15270 [Anaerolineae bacterium]